MVLTACLSFDISATISLDVSTVALGKSGLYTLVPEQRASAIEGLLGLVSGVVIAVFGIVFLLATVQATYL